MGDNRKVPFTDLLKYSTYTLYNCQDIYARYTLQDTESFKLDSFALLHQLRTWENYFCLAFNNILFKYDYIQLSH
jgi:hypothetical protein